MGTKASTVVRVPVALGHATSEAPSTAASRTPRPSRTNRPMFSTTTMASSTSKPRAITNPTMDICCRPYPRQVHAGQGERDGQRNRDHDEQGSPEAHEQEHDEPHEGDPLEQAREEAVDPGAYALGLVEDRMELQPFRETIGEVLHHRLHPVEDGEDVGAFPLDHAEEDGRPALVSSPVFFVLRRPADLGHVPHTEETPGDSR